MTPDTRKLREAFLSEYEATGRNLDAALAAVALVVEARRPTITRVAFIRSPLQKPPPPAPAKRVVPAERIARLLDAVAAHFDLTRASAFDRRFFRRSSAHPRWVAAACLREADMAQVKIAEAVGLRDHTAIVYALRKVRASAELSALVARFAPLVVDAVDVDGQRPATTAETARHPQPASKAAQRPAAVSTLSGEEAA